MRVLIIGATGTLGRAMIDKLRSVGDYRITAFSRCELKQAELKALYGDINMKYVLGDMRDRDSVMRAVEDKDIIFHFAALKHVDLMELNPIECYKTNILGTQNVVDACLKYCPKYAVFSSTDKACYPINVYGMSKATSERLWLFNNFKDGVVTKFSVYRWGNILGSRGSIIPKFISDIRRGNNVKVTDINMSRFWLKIEDAVDFVHGTFKTVQDNKVRIPSVKSAKVIKVIESIARILRKDPTIQFVGLRPGEKLAETLQTTEEGQLISSDTSYQYTDDELDELLRPMCKS